MEELSDEYVWEHRSFYFPIISDIYNRIIKKQKYNDLSYRYILLILSGYYGLKNRKHMLKHKYIKYGKWKKKIYSYQPMYNNKFVNLKNFLILLNIKTEEDIDYLYNINKIHKK